MRSLWAIDSPMWHSDANVSVSAVNSGNSTANSAEEEEEEEEGFGSASRADQGRHGHRRGGVVPSSADRMGARARASAAFLLGLLTRKRAAPTTKPRVGRKQTCSVGCKSKRRDAPSWRRQVCFAVRGVFYLFLPIFAHPTRQPRNISVINLWTGTLDHAGHFIWPG